MFMISEVHPFIDGNGRIARIMMNAELFRGGQSRIIVPTVFREDYILALRKLKRSKEPDTYIRVMEKLHKFSDYLFGSDFDDLNNYLIECNAYEEPQKAHLKYIERVFVKKRKMILIKPWKMKRNRHNKIICADICTYSIYLRQILSFARKNYINCTTFCSNHK
jgi:Fic family protein